MGPCLCLIFVECMKRCRLRWPSHSSAAWKGLTSATECEILSTVGRTSATDWYGVLLTNTCAGEAVTVIAHVLFGNQPSGLTSDPNFLPVWLPFWIVIPLKVKGMEKVVTLAALKALTVTQIEQCVSTLAFLTFGIRLLRFLGWSHALRDVCQHPWLLLTRCRNTCDNRKCFQTSPMIPGGQHSPGWEPLS